MISAIISEWAGNRAQFMHNIYSNQFMTFKMPFMEATVFGSTEILPNKTLGYIFFNLV